MPVQKSAKPSTAGKPADRKPVQSSTPSASKAQLKVVKSDPKPASKVAKPVPTKSTAKTDKASAKEEAKKTAKTAVPADEPVKKKPGRPPKATAEAEAPAKGGAKRGRKPKAEAAKPGVAEEVDLTDVEADFEDGEPVVEEVAAVAEKVKPLRMKISKAKERALMKEFGLDETILTEEEMLKRRQRLKSLIKLGKTRGYLTHAEITDHLPEKLVDAASSRIDSGRSWGWTSAPLATSTDRSMAFSSSRTLPGHRKRISSWYAAGEMPLSDLL